MSEQEFDPNKGYIALLGWSLNAVEAADKFDRRYVVVAPDWAEAYCKEHDIPYVPWNFERLNDRSVEIAQTLKEAVCGGQTGHAEVVDVHYDPQTVSFGDILKVFFSVAHDPTQLNRQGNDRGTQYRSAVFYENDEQKQVAEAYIRQLNSAGVYDNPLVTTLEPLEAFYPAEDYHQNFAARNPYQPYIMAVAAPKIEKLVDTFGDQLKPGYTDNNIA